ncbi:Coatomer, WD associated region [Cucumis melo var. makuwa]|uniref:Coatomer, WD associated region n=1 Tax=Cucumis melo var. makuwa TaxID=1194695 RepID=A0A5A7SRK9_CUCMM|nr:Coatomer, WD associated region [Cucumis melo var. makuwa]
MFEVTDGERLPLAVKEMGTCDLYPQSCSYLIVTLLHIPRVEYVWLPIQVTYQRRGKKVNGGETGAAGEGSVE